MTLVTSESNPQAAGPLLSLQGVSKAYRNPGETTPVFEDLDLELHRGEITCLVGPSGCGKSTIISLIAGLMSYYEVEVTLEDGSEVDVQLDRSFSVVGSEGGGGAEDDE